MIIILRANNKKRIFAAALAAVLLTGCAGGETPAESTAAPTVPEATVTEPSAQPGLYVPDSPVERATDGAVKLYHFDGSVTGLAVLGENLAICTDGNTLRLLETEAMTQIKERPLDSELSWSEVSLVLTDSGMARYDEAVGAYVVLDENLVNTATVAIAEDLSCAPIISRDFTTIYYACAEGIKAMDLTSGVSRMLRQEHGQVIRMDGLLLDDTVLHYTRRMEDGSEQSCFVDAENGASRHAGVFHGQIVTGETSVSGVVKLNHPMGALSWIVSADESGSKLLTRDSGWDSVIPLDGDRVLVQKVDQMGLHLSLYSLSSNTYSAVMLPQFRECFTYGSLSGSTLWLCDGVSGKFYCWDTARNPVDKVTEPLVSAEASTQELAANLTDRADALSKQYGVKITLDHGVDLGGALPEYRTALFAQALELLEQELKRVPLEFWAAIGKTTDSGTLQIVLTDGFDPKLGVADPESSFSMADGEAVITLDICRELPEHFCRQLWNVMEVRIRNRSDKLASWNQYNPEGFSYTGDEAAWERGELESSEYLIPGENWFASSYAMVTARADQSETFLHACFDGNADRYQSAAMQEKLETLCSLIRKVYKLDDELVLPWEQYLAPETAEGE